MMSPAKPALPSLTASITLALLLLFVSSTIAQTDDTTKPGSYTIIAADGRIEFPFEIYRGDIRFQCKVNGHPVHMLFDDGYFWDQLLFWGGPAVDSLDLTYDGDVGVGEEGGTVMDSKIASGLTVELPGVRLTEQTVIVTPASSGNATMWFGSIGQISASFFKHFIVDINFDKMTITLIEPDKFTYRGSGVAVPWEPMSHGPRSIPATITTEDGRRIPLLAMLDLGYNDALQLVTGCEHNIPVPKKSLPASLGFDITGDETRGHIGRVSQIEIEGYKLNGVVAAFAEAKNDNQAIEESMIGLELLSRFNLVYDFYGRKLYIEPNKSFDTPFEYSMSGFVVRRTRDGAVIQTIYDDSPASKAGLHVGDRIIELNGKAPGEYDYYALQNMLRKRGESITLLIERDSSKQTVSLVLDRVI